MIIDLAECLKCPWFYYCHATNFQDRTCMHRKSEKVPDQDTLQLQDEQDTSWVQAWCEAVGKVYLAEDLRTGKIIAFKIPVEGEEVKDWKV